MDAASQSLKNKEGWADGGASSDEAKSDSALA